MKPSGRRSHPGGRSAACTTSTPTTPQAPFSVVEATIPEMQKAMHDGRTSSRQMVEQYLQRIALYNSTLQRGDHGQSEGARRSRPSRSGTQGRQDPRAAARHPDRAQGQHPHHRHPHHRRRDRVRGPDAAVRRDADEEPARRRRGDHRQDDADRAGQLRRPTACRATTTPSPDTRSTRTIRAAIRVRPPPTAGRC